MNKAYIKILSFLIVVYSVIYTPFSYNVLANDSASAPFIGFNVNVIGYDKEGVVKLSQSSTNNNFTGDITNVLLIERTSGGVTYQTSTANVGSVTGNGGVLSGNIDLKLSSATSYIYDRVIEIELLLDNYYTGYVDFIIITIQIYNIKRYIIINTIILTLIIRKFYSS